MELEARHLVSGESFCWSSCRPHEELPQSVIDPSAAMADALLLEHCSVPEYGDVLQWCELNRDACVGTDDADCGVYDAVCNVTLREAFDFLRAMEAERESRDGGVDGGVEASHGHESGADAGESASHDSGCGLVQARGSRSTTGVSALLALACLLAGRRSNVRKRGR